MFGHKYQGKILPFGEFVFGLRQPLKKKGAAKGKKSAKQRIVPFDPLDDVPLPKGFPDSPPPKPSDPLDNLDGSGNANLT